MYQGLHTAVLNGNRNVLSMLLKMGVFPRTLDLVPHPHTPPDVLCDLVW